MGTTLVLAHRRAEQLWVMHVGDSRAYLLTGDGMRRLTTDHSNRGYLTQALGIREGVTPDLVEAAVTAGDRLLLCTDGLTNMVMDGDIADLLACGTPQEAVDRLVGTALERGGLDNVTVVVADG